MYCMLMSRLEHNRQAITDKVVECGTRLKPIKTQNIWIDFGIDIGAENTKEKIKYNVNVYSFFRDSVRVGFGSFSSLHKEGSIDGFQ